MLRDFENWFLKQDEPAQSCLLSLRKHILQVNPSITEAWKYGMPFFCVGKKMFCYLWTDKKTGWPYIGIVEGNRIEHPDLVQEKRARMKILPIDPNKNIPVKKIELILGQALLFYPNGLK
ncbi:MAG: DUF1801 domain-containing protein [Bacteroidia bacterium]